MKYGGIVGFVVYKDRDDDKGMEIFRDDIGTVVLFTNHDAAKSESGWLDVVSPITRKDLRELNCPPKNTRRNKKNGRERPYAWVIYPITKGESRRVSKKKRKKKKQVHKKRGCVYLIKAKGLDGVYKIGLSIDPQQRVQDLQSYCPVPLEIEYTITNKHGGNIERVLHKRFRAGWMHHEWFRLSAQDIDWIRCNYDLRPYRNARFAS